MYNPKGTGVHACEMVCNTFRLTYGVENPEAVGGVIRCKEERGGKN